MPKLDGANYYYDDAKAGAPANPTMQGPTFTKGTAPACPIFSFGFGVRMEPESHAPALKTGDAYRKSPSTD